MLFEILKWLIVALAALNFGFMLFDGSRALITGDYIRPKTGDYAGKLGPWDKLVMALGINPMSVFMKSVFVVFGVVGLCITAGFALNCSWGWQALLIANMCSVWYLVFGTISSVLQIIGLCMLQWLV